MAYYKLIRETVEGKEVRGTLYRVEHRYSGSCGEYKEYLTPVCDTLENADYMIPALVYKVSVTQSPKFRRMLPILLQVPGRTGIRVHQGLRPEHSKGCILVRQEKEHLLTELWLKEQQNHDETRIEICDCRRSAKGLDQSPL